MLSVPIFPQLFWGLSAGTARGRTRRPFESSRKTHGGRATRAHTPTGGEWWQVGDHGNRYIRLSQGVVVLRTHSSLAAGACPSVPWAPQEAPGGPPGGSVGREAQAHRTPLPGEPADSARGSRSECCVPNPSYDAQGVHVPDEEETPQVLVLHEDQTCRCGEWRKVQLRSYTEVDGAPRTQNTTPSRGHHRARQRQQL